jgi:tight adherence protein B
VGPSDRLVGLARAPHRAPALLAALALLPVLVWVDGRRLVLVLILLAVAAGAATLVVHARARKTADRRQVKVVETCEALVGELRAGSPPVAGLEHCAGLWPELAPVLAAARLGADVPSALRDTAALAGAAGLREVAAAWQVSERSGAALSTALAQVAATARARLRVRNLVRAELASAQATARTVAAMPVAALGIAAGVGADPWHFLLDTPAGLACLGVGLGLALLGLAWIDRIAVAVLEP